MGALGVVTSFAFRSSSDTRRIQSRLAANVPASDSNDTATEQHANISDRRPGAAIVFTGHNSTNTGDTINAKTMKNAQSGMTATPKMGRVGRLYLPTLFITAWAQRRAHPTRFFAGSKCTNSGIKEMP